MKLPIYALRSAAGTNTRPSQGKFRGVKKSEVPAADTGLRHSPTPIPAAVSNKPEILGLEHLQGPVSVKLPTDHLATVALKHSGARR